MKRMWLYLLAIPLLAGCIGDEFDTDRISDEMDFSSGIALPLAKAQLTMGDILSEDTDFVKYFKDEQGNERIMLFQDADSLAYVGLDDFFKLSSQSIDIPIPYAVFNMQSEISQSASIPLSLPNATVSTIDLNYTLSVNGSNLLEPMRLLISFPTASGTQDVEIEVRNGNAVTNVIENQRINLVNNEVPVELSIRPLTSGTTFTDQLGNITIEMSEFAISYVKGSMAESRIDIDNGMHNLEMDIFETFPDGVEFDNPRFKILTNNSTPFSGLIDTKIKGKLAENEYMDLITPLISMPACPTSQSVKSDTLTIDKNNSNLKDFLYDVPETFEYSGELVLNPGGTLTEEVELDQKSRIYMGYVIEIPIEVVINSSFDVDTIDLDDNDFLQDLSRAKLQINSQNGFPFEATAFIEFYEGDEMTETIQIKAINAAGINDEGIVSSITEGKEEIGLTNEQLEKLRTADKLFVRMTLQTTNYADKQVVVLLKENELAIQISLKGVINY
ncbi:hypothetical protein [Carboxylicivirga sp. N1Y90]|uniref:hypothetical protein n=1 Tax=Carboxylicivirga fragile TaxID=3417571 RepID=UPI003D331E8A|nr:hypothetical protein [Marinilabiliaceae bacterium N1Y90]